MPRPLPISPPALSARPPPDLWVGRDRERLPPPTLPYFDDPIIAFEPCRAPNGRPCRFPGGDGAAAPSRICSQQKPRSRLSFPGFLRMIRCTSAIVLCCFCRRVERRARSTIRWGVAASATRCDPCFYTPEPRGAVVLCRAVSELGADLCPAKCSPVAARKTPSPAWSEWRTESYESVAHRENP